MISVKGLSVTYRQRNATVPVIENISFELGRGQTCAVIGPSGCGKTTLLYVLAGLRPEFDGHVLVAGEPVKSRRLKTAVILQDYGLFPWKTVWQNTLLGLQLRNLAAPEIEARCRRILDELGLSALTALYPAQLSGGQRQRVAIARALSLDPDLLLMDEPFSSLDFLTREALQDSLLEIWKRRGVTILFVTHSIPEAVYLGQRIIVLSGRPSRILADFENPGVGERAWRKSRGFHELSNSLREMLNGERDVP
ncbi:ABC transporter ATP-binding protein [Desulforudis sp. 1088]|uniref:ABC transporter ATP-binding protein n=1 Tax=unclassified Candidatus Desulforudis TaxID=2635950 RepID=UPI003CE4A5E1